MFRNRKQSGFTLMEMIVAVGIFVIVLTAATGVFLAIFRVQRKTAAMQRTQQDARWAMETMARYARMNKIDYDSQTEFNGGNELYLIDSEGTSIHFWLDGTELKMGDNVITPVNVVVEDLKFYISPDSNPYNPGGVNEQSRVTILLDTESAEARPAEQAKMTLQTTVSTRAYTR